MGMDEKELKYIVRTELIKTLNVQTYVEKIKSTLSSPVEEHELEEALGYYEGRGDISKVKKLYEKKLSK
jgi:hypothetical protein